jgi:hypothetical protein
MGNKSKVIILVLALIIIGLCGILLKKNTQEPVTVDTPKEEDVQNTPISTTQEPPTEESIKEENFTGTKSIIKGSSVLANAARLYMDQTLASFKQSADQDVPDMRAKFGTDSPTAKYEIDLKATYIKGDKTESIIIDNYVYTGGANGDDSYKVFTASKSTGKILSLSDIILSTKHDAFVAYMKKALANWRPEGGKYSVVFPEEVGALTFDSFSNFSLSSKNLIIYFDKFAIGPGVLGAVAFPVPLSKIQGFLVPGY